MAAADSATRSGHHRAQAGARSQRLRDAGRTLSAWLDDAGVTVALAAAVACACLYLLLFAFAPAA